MECRPEKLRRPRYEGKVAKLEFGNAPQLLYSIILAVRHVDVDANTK